MGNKLVIPLKSNKPHLYDFGYSAIDNINTVTNWQRGQNVMVNVPDGTFYFFARPIHGGRVLKVAFTVNCLAPCVVAASGYTVVKTVGCMITASGYNVVAAPPQVSEGVLITGINT